MAHHTVKQGHMDLVEGSTVAAVFGDILQLPPVKRSMARGQLGSRYLDKLIEWNERPGHSA